MQSGFFPGSGEQPVAFFFFTRGPGWGGGAGLLLVSIYRRFHRKLAAMPSASEEGPELPRRPRLSLLGK